MACLEFVLSIATEGPRKVCITPLPARPKLLVPLSFEGGFVVRGDNLMTTLSDVQKVTLGPVTGTDAPGNPAPLEGITFVSSDPAILEVTDNGDGTAVVRAVGPLGNAQVTTTADAQIGEGEVLLPPDVKDFTVVASIATGLSVPVGTPENQ